MLKNSLKNSKGFGLVEAMISAGLVILLALSIAYFIYGQSRSTARLERSGKAMAIADNIVEYIKKDEATLAVTSVEISSINTFSSTELTEDGVLRFGAVPIPAVVSNGAVFLDVPHSESTTDTGTWVFNNHLNIRNSMNRLVAMAMSNPVCCSDLDIDSSISTGAITSSCGAVIYNSSDITAAGFTGNPLNLQEDPNADVLVVMAINFAHASSPDTSLCSGSNISTNNLPRPSERSFADIKVRVYVNPGSPELEKISEATGRVQFSTTDVGRPLTIMQIESGPSCYDPDADGDADASSNMFICNPSATSVVLRARTVQNRTAAGDCADCIASVARNRCELNASGILPTTISACTVMVDTASGSTTPDCVNSDPGSIFLCRIGETTWFRNNPEFWEPCHLARVRELTPAGTQTIQSAAVVNTQYINVMSGGSMARYTEAVITLTNLGNNRAYNMDVRAVDTAGNVGVSYCYDENGGAPLASGNCANPLFVIADTQPVSTNLVETTRGVSIPVASATATAGIIGAQYFSHAVTALETANIRAGTLAQFGANFYQCTGTPSATPLHFQSNISYPSSSNPNIFSDFDIQTCSATITMASGSVIDLPCSCEPTVSGASTSCSFNASVTNADLAGNYQARIIPRNLCNMGVTTNSSAVNWCFAKAASAGTVAATNVGSTPTSPGFQLSGASTCGLAVAYENVAGALAYSNLAGVLNLNAAALGWNDNTNSGCLADPGVGTQFCAFAMDPCGRKINSNGLRYSTKLVTNLAAANSCAHGQNGGPIYQVLGNECDTGFCDSTTFKCTATGGAVCNNDADCSGSDCNNVPGTCGGQDWFCQSLHMRTGGWGSGFPFVGDPCYNYGVCTATKCVFGTYVSTQNCTLDNECIDSGSCSGVGCKVYQGTCTSSAKSCDICVSPANDNVTFATRNCPAITTCEAPVALTTNNLTCPVRPIVVPPIGCGCKETRSPCVAGSQNSTFSCEQLSGVACLPAACAPACPAPAVISCGTPPPGPGCSCQEVSRTCPLPLPSVEVIDNECMDNVTGAAGCGTCGACPDTAGGACPLVSMPAYNWRTYAWGACVPDVAFCGLFSMLQICQPSVGDQTRVVQCEEMSSPGVPVADGLCAGAKPATTQDCDGPCPTYFHRDSACTALNAPGVWTWCGSGCCKNGGTEIRNCP